MIKQMAWNTFKNTGNINTFLEIIEFENIEENVVNKTIKDKEWEALKQKE